MPHAYISALVLAFTYTFLQTYMHECETTHTYMHRLKHTHRANKRKTLGFP